MKSTIDIGSDKEICKAASKLSNFTEHHFYVDGVFCRSMEGFLQSLKFDDISKQIDICNLYGVKAKNKGSRKNWKKNQLLYWKGEVIDRHSQDYQDLLDKAFTALFSNQEFQALLSSTGDSQLDHSIGKVNPRHTILTIDEFCSRLMIFRDYHLNKSR